MNALYNLHIETARLVTWRRVLTDRETAVISLVQQGLRNKQIAYALGMSEETVKTHVKRSMRKLGAKNRTDAAFKALALAESMA